MVRGRHTRLVCVVIKYTVTARLVPEALLMLTIRTRHQAGGVRLIVAHPFERLLLSAGKVSKISKVLYILTWHSKILGQ